MAEKDGNIKLVNEFAKRIDPDKENLTREQLQFIQQAELAQWRKRGQKLRIRNILTGLAIGAVVMGISDGYTFYSVSQEKIMKELDEEAKVIDRIQNPRKG